MSTWSRFKRPLLAALGVIAAGTAHTTSAQVAGPPYYVKGSDTLFDIVTQSINKKIAADAACAAAGNCPSGMPTIQSNQIIYDGTGSGNGENDLKATVGGGNNLGIQSIAPMSRNFRPATLTQFPSWAPTIQNVVGLDAAVIATKNVASHCKNWTLPTTGDGNGFTIAVPNVASTSINFGTAGSGYTQLLEVILSGIDGSGSTAACADQRRVQAVADFASCNNVAAINHFYRRDDNSGTTNTFQDKVAVQRFCNGAAVGTLGTNKGHPNLNNQDLDPIRRPCDVPTSARYAVACTNISTGAACCTAVGDPTCTAACTQGLVSAISENDPGYTDFSISIAERVGNDSSGATVGYAGRTSVELPTNTTTPIYINTNPPSKALTRLDAYLLARRLWLQRGPSNPALDASVTFSVPPPPSSGPPSGCTGSACGNQRANDLAGPSASLTCPDGSSNKCQGGGTSQRALEDTLFAYMTDSNGGASPDGAPGRCNVDPLVDQFGFFTCLDDCTATPTGNSNLCSKTPYLPIPAPPAACLPTNGNGGPTWNYGAVTSSVKNSSSTAGPTAPVCCANNAAATLSAGSCSSNSSIACTTTTGCPSGDTCNFTASCPAAPGRVANSACSTIGVQAECGTGLTCQDLGLGFGVCE